MNLFVSSECRDFSIIVSIFISKGVEPFIGDHSTSALHQNEINVRIFSGAKFLFFCVTWKTNLNGKLFYFKRNWVGMAGSARFQLNSSVKSEFTSFLIFIDFFFSVCLQAQPVRWNKWNAPDSKCGCDTLTQNNKKKLCLLYSVSVFERTLQMCVRSSTNFTDYKCQIWTITLDFGTRC